MAESRSPWFYVLSGCAVLLVVGGVVIAALAVFTWNKAREFQETLRDPEKRAERVVDVLGGPALPDGWRPGFAMSVPFLGEMAMLSAGETTVEDDGFDMGERVFVYLQMIGDKAGEARRRFEEGGDLDAFLRDPNLEVDLDREVGRGTAQVDGGLMMWVSGYGDANVQGRRVEGLSTIGLIDCDADRRSRFVAWFGDPVGDAVEDPEVAGALNGTIADPDVLTEFLAHFRLCPE